MKKTCLAAAVATALTLGANAAQALTIVFDYSLDTTGFFTADKRATLDQVASIFEHNVTTHLAALNNVNLSTGDMDGHAGTALSVSHLNIPADTLRIYVDAVDLTGGTLGLAYVGTAGPARNSNFGFGSGFGGQMLFDNKEDLSYLGGAYTGQTRARDWYVDGDIRTTEAMGFSVFPFTPGHPEDGSYVLNQFDFASVAMHELGHVFGLGHSAAGDAMSPTVSGGTRQLFNGNDWNAMTAAGWTVASVNPNLNVVVDVTPVPEPASVAMMLAGLAGVGAAARRRKG